MGSSIRDILDSETRYPQAKINNRRVETRILHKDDQFDQRVRDDYDELSTRVNLATTESAKELLLMQSIEGRAKEGAGAFRTRTNTHFVHSHKYVNTTIGDIVGALVSPQDVEKIQRERQAVIKGIRSWLNLASTEVLAVLNGTGQGYTKSYRLLDRENKPLAGIEMFNHITVNNPLLVLQGFYLGSCMDTYDPWRTWVKEEYDLELGGGDCLAVHLPRLGKEAERRREKGELIDHNLEILASKEHTEEDMEVLRQKGIIRKSGKTQTGDGWVQGYIRRKIGYGVSDDAAVLTAGIMLGATPHERIQAALGVVLADAVDTWDKYTQEIYSGGQDELMGKQVEENLNGRLGISEEDVLKFIYASAIDPMRKSHYPDCSQRRFLEIHPTKRNTYALLSHLHYLETYDPDNPTFAERLLPELIISFKGVPAKRFRKTYTARLKELKLLAD